MFAQNKLKDLGIPTMVYYPKPLHKQTVYKDYDFNLGDLKESERDFENLFKFADASIFRY